MRQKRELKTVNAVFKPGEELQVAVANCHDVLEEIRKTDFTSVQAVYFGVLDKDGTLRLAENSGNNFELVGMLQAHATSVLNQMAFYPDGETEEDDDAGSD